MIRKLLLLIYLLIGVSALRAETFLPLSFETKFIQTHINSISGKTKQSEGELKYKYPGRIRFEVVKPDQVVFVSNLERSWFYTPPVMEGEPGDVTISKSSDNPLLKFLDTLKGGLKNSKSYRVQNPTPNTVIVFFNEKSQKEVGLKEAKLTFSKGEEFKDLKNLHLTYPDGKIVQFELRDLNIKPKLNDETFIFVIPKNTRIAK